MTDSRDKRRLLPFAWALLFVLGLIAYFTLQRQQSLQPQSTTTQLPATIASSSSAADASVAVVKESAPPANLDPRTQWINELTAWLERQGDADSLMTAALIIHSEKSRSVQMREAREKTLSLLRRSLALRPDDALLAWLGYSLCEEKYGCDPGPFDLALRANDPENALSWLSDLQRATSAQDPDAIAAAVKELAKRPRFELYAARMSSTLSERITSARVSPPQYPAGAEGASISSEATLLPAAIAALLPYPPLRPISDACRDASDLRAECRTLAATIRRGDTMIVQGFGAQLSDHLDRSNVSQPGRADSRRKFDWVMFNVGQISVQPGYMRQLIAESGGEFQAYERLLRENGIPLDPPRGWVRP